MNGTNNIITEQLGNGCYISYNEVRNGFGGYHPVNLYFYNGKKKLCQKITDKFGYFVDYPGHESGKWEKELTMAFLPATRFVVNVYGFADGIYRLAWMVQPDGRYWADDDGFGMTSDDEVWLYAHINDEGKFVTPFFDEENEKYNH